MCTSGLEHFVDDISPLQKHADFLLLRVRRISGYFTMSTISKASGIKKKRWRALSYTAKTPQTCCKLSILPALCDMSNSSSCSKSVVAVSQTCHLHNAALLQVVTSLWITSFDSQRATGLLTTFRWLFVNQLSQAMRSRSSDSACFSNSA